MARSRIPARGLRGDRFTKISTHMARFQFFNSDDRDNGSMEEWVKQNNINGDWIQHNFPDASCFVHLGVYAMTARGMKIVEHNVRMVSLIHDSMTRANAFQDKENKSTPITAHMCPHHSGLCSVTTNIIKACVTAHLRAGNASAITHGNRATDELDVKSQAFSSQFNVTDIGEEKLFPVFQQRKSVVTDIEIARPITTSRKNTEPRNLNKNGTDKASTTKSVYLADISNDSYPGTRARAKEIQSARNDKREWIDTWFLQDKDFANSLSVRQRLDVVKPDLGVGVAGRKIQVGWTYGDEDLWCDGVVLSMSSSKKKTGSFSRLGYTKKVLVWHAEILFQPRRSFETHTIYTVKLEESKWSLEESPRHHAWRLIKD